MRTSEVRRSDGRHYFLMAGVAFVVSRLLVLPFAQPASDVGIYAEYAREAEVAAREGRSFYELHAAGQQGQAAGRVAGSAEDYRDVEYPPLALAVLRLPVLWMRPADADAPADFAASFTDAYRRGLAVIDVLLFAAVAWLVRRIHPAEDGRRQARRLLFYVLGTLALWHLLYDRLDLFQALAVTLALALLVSRRHYLWSFVALAIAINFKLVPVVLAPVWVVGALPADRPPDGSPRTAARVAWRGLLLAGLTLGLLLPFYLRYGPDCLAFFRYHQARGLEVASTWSCLPLALHVLGQPVEVAFSYGSINVRSPLTPALVALAPAATAALLLAATGLLLWRARRLGTHKSEAPVRDVPSPALRTYTLAQLWPSQFAAFALLFLTLFVATNKVFSPQYLLWLLPLAALVPFEGRPRRLFLAGFLLVCVLSTVLMPFLFAIDLIDRPPGGGPPEFHPPTPRFVAVLLLRNLLFLALTAALTVRLTGRPCQAQAGPPGG